jgi:hypothetical protein
VWQFKTKKSWPECDYLSAAAAAAAASLHEEVALGVHLFLLSCANPDNAQQEISGKVWDHYHSVTIVIASP